MNCVIVGGKRARIAPTEVGGPERVDSQRDSSERLAACLVPSTKRVDVNGVVRRRLNVRKASFLPQADAVERTGMAYGGITAIGLPEGWPILVDADVAAIALVVIGSGIRASKLLVPGALLAQLPGAQTIAELGRAG